MTLNFTKQEFCAAVLRIGGDFVPKPYHELNEYHIALLPTYVNAAVMQAFTSGRLLYDDPDVEMIRLAMDSLQYPPHLFEFKDIDNV